MLPVLFIVLASLALGAALIALFASLRATLGVGRDTTWLDAGPDRGALEDEKNALLRALKDLEYEHEVGKIDDDDHARLERAYRARAKEVLGELDRDLRPYLSRAEELAAGVVEKKKEKKKKGKIAHESTKAKESEPESEPETESKSEPEDHGESEPAPSTPASESESARPICSACSTANDIDARFCKQCAAPLSASPS